MNPNINPKRIHIGDTILIPEDLLKTQRLMPAGFPSSINRRRKIKNPQPQDVHPPAKIEEATLFGPIGNDSPAKKTEDNQLPVPLETIDR